MGISMLLYKQTNIETRTYTTGSPQASSSLGPINLQTNYVNNPHSCSPFWAGNFAGMSSHLIVKSKNTLWANSSPSSGDPSVFASPHPHGARLRNFSSGFLCTLRIRSSDAEPLTALLRFIELMSSYNFVPCAIIVLSSVNFVR